jgi:hypothetical protein
VRLSRPLPLNVIYAPAELFVLLSELVIDGSDERAGFLVLPVMIFPFLHMLNLDVHRQAFTNELEFVPEAFDENTCVPLDFIKTLVMIVQSLFNSIKALVNLAEAFVNSVKALVNSIKALVASIKALNYLPKPVVNLIKSLINSFKALIEPLKTPIEVLNQFLIHSVSENRQ